MKARIRKLFAAPVFEGDEDKTRRGRLLNAVLLLDTAGMSSMIGIDLLSGGVPWYIISLEFAAVFVLLVFRIPLRRGKLTGASLGAMVLFLLLATAALVSLGTTRDPTLGTFILLVVTAGLLLGRRAILGLTAGCILAVSAVMIAESAGLLPAPRTAVSLSDWGTITVLLIASAGAALWFREGIEKSLFLARQELGERIRAEEALRASEERFRELSSMTSEGIMIHEGGVILDANQAFADLIGRPNPEGLIGKNGLEIIPFDSDSRQRVLDHIRSASDEIYEIGLVKPDGSPRPAETQGKKIVYRGRQARFVSLRDITEAKRAKESLRRSADQLRRTLKEAINALSAAIEMRDPYTAGHQEGVAKLAEAIGREMGLSEAVIEALQIAAIVHDIGKMSVPAEILSKPTQLTSIEFSLIKAHARAGYDILSKIDFPWPIAEIVYQHHERLDGSGYPRGLFGKDLLIEARIISVADTMEAMSSHRPYRPAQGIEAALLEISGQRGILYEAAIVDACLRVFSDRKFRF